MKTLVVVLILAASFPVFGASGLKRVLRNEQPIRFENAFAQRLFIQGNAGQVTLIPSSKKEVVIQVQKSMVVPTETPNEQAQEILRQMVVRTNSNQQIIEVRAEILGTKSDWAQWVTSHYFPEVKLQITAPESTNVEIYWGRGSVQVQRWKGSVILTGIDGNYQLSNVAGNVIARTNIGSLKIEDIRGGVLLEDVASPVDATDVRGAFKGRSFTAPIKFKNIEGGLDLSSYRGGLTGEDTRGPASLETYFSSIKLLGHRGPITVKSENGNVVAELKGVVEAKVSTGVGDVILTVPRTSHAKVQAVSAKGRLVVPKSLAVKKTPGEHVATGTLSGRESGSVQIYSRNGKITLKQAP